MRPNGSKGRVFAVGDPARQSRDGDGKIPVRGGEAMAAKRTTAQGGFAQRNAAPDFARQTQKVGPMTGRAVSRSEMRPNGSKRRVFAVGAPARRSRDGNGKIAAPVGPVTGRAVSRSEMEADLRPTSAFGTKTGSCCKARRRRRRRRKATPKISKWTWKTPR